MIDKINKYDYWEEVPGASQIIREINVKRIAYAGIIVIFFQMLNLINRPFLPENYESCFYIRLGIYMLIPISVFFILISRIFYKKIVENTIISRILYIFFWTALIAGMTPYLINDILYSSAAPINLTLLCTFLIAIPIFSKIELCIIYVVYLAYNVALIAIFHAPYNYFIFSFGIILAAFFISIFVQYQYISMLLKLNFEVRIDYLTGIMNRRGGIDKIHTVLELTKRQNARMVVYMVDIDYFKKYNDKYGHLQGDKALQAVAKTLATTFIRVSDVICRYGGEEFLICSVIKDNNEAKLMAGRIQNNIGDLKIASADSELSEYLTVSIGYSIYNAVSDDMATDVNKLIDLADKALYDAKNSGRNQIASLIYFPVNNN